MNRLYSFRRCPYAMRARMALRYSAVPLAIVEVSLKAKPPEMLALSSKGTVPVLSTDGRVIDESLQIMAWALAQNDPEDWLLKDNPVAQSLTAALIEENDQVFKVSLNRYKYAERYPQHSREHYRSEGEVFLRKLDGLLQQQRYLVADHPSLADIALMPFIRQFAHVDRDGFAQLPYTQLQVWLEGLIESALFTAIMAKQPEHH
ncbi:glutathione S-transferase [Pseudomonas sp. P5_152]|uniref:glutathione S-transferase n=1 Tax=Pseudomonas sp. P5_152 TaxID=3043442 RepID=UPI002A368C0F|nr:glutathione S-transferase [Pseudomonas sp. P5_152]MDX9663380.1 glutathione S-transferase [Pseudomonas sp. P5_152]